MDSNTIKYNSNTSFGHLKIKKSAYKTGRGFIERDKAKLEELAQTCNIKISGGKEFMGSFSRACLNIKVTPLERSRNPFVRLFNLDAVTGKFATECSVVSTTFIGMTRRLVNKLINK